MRNKTKSVHSTSSCYRFIYEFTDLSSSVLGASQMYTKDKQSCVLWLRVSKLFSWSKYLSSSLGLFESEMVQGEASIRIFDAYQLCLIQCFKKIVFERVTLLYNLRSMLPLCYETVFL